jgi:hypothetical protein
MEVFQKTIIVANLSRMDSKFSTVWISEISALKKAAVETHFLGMQRPLLFHSSNHGPLIF